MATPLVLQYAFRICFLTAAMWAAAAMPIWLCAYEGWIVIAPAYGGMNWHAHEMIFGYAALVICGFLFTAIPSWTNRPPVRGRPLAVLMVLWASGRTAMLLAEQIGPIAAAVIDLLFLVAILVIAGREIAAGKNWHNAPILVLVGLLTAANAWFHAAALMSLPVDMALRAAIGMLVVLITVIGGRLVPNFTRNWLVKRNVSQLPSPFGRLDATAIAAAVAGIVAWVIAPDGRITAAVAATAAALLALRLARWRGWSTWREPLLLVLHIGYGFVPIGFALLAAASIRPDLIPANVVTHAWTVGAVGTMTLAVMTRATLGHTGRALTATGATTAIYVAIVFAAVTRVVAPLTGDLMTSLLLLSGLSWTLAFVGFVAAYGPIVVTPRLEPAH